MFLAAVIYNVALCSSFPPADWATFCHVYECKAKEELSSKSNLNFENFLIQKKFW